MKRTNQKESRAVILRFQRTGLLAISEQAAALAHASDNLPVDAPTNRGQQLAILPRGGRSIAIARMLLAGCSNRAMEKAKLCTKDTARNIRRKLEKLLNATIRCPCGQPATHQGWCSLRYSKSPARKAFIKEWTKRRGKP